MQENKNHIDEFLQQALSQASADAPGIDWNGFENHRNRKKKRRIFYIVLASILPLFLILIGWCYLGQSESSTVDSMAKNNTENKPVKNPRANNKSVNPHNEQQTNVLKTLKTTAENNNRKYSVPAPLFNQAETNATNTSGEKPIGNAAIDLRPQNPSQEIPVDEMHENPEPKISFVKWQGLKPLWSALPAWLQNAVIEREPRELKPTISNENRSFVQFQIGPNINNPSFKTTPLGAAFIHKNYTRILNQFETGRGGYSWQLNGGIQKNRWSGMAGIGMSQLKNAADFDYEYSEVPIIDINSKIIGYNQSAPQRMQFNANQHYTFLEIPLYAQYTFIQKPKTSYSLRTGMVNQLLYQLGGVLPNSVYLDRQEQMQNGNYKSYTFSWELGLPFEYKTSSNMSLSLTPYYRHNAGFKQLQSLYTSQFNNWGLYFNLKYYMNK